MDADSFFNKDDLTIDERSSMGEGSTGLEERWGYDQNGTDLSSSGPGRRSSLGAIWDYLLTSRGERVCLWGGKHGEMEVLHRSPLCRYFMGPPP